MKIYLPKNNRSFINKEDTIWNYVLDKYNNIQSIKTNTNFISTSYTFEFFSDVINFGRKIIK